MVNPTPGGADSRFRKINGIGEYSNKVCKTKRNTDEKQQDNGEYP